MATDTVSLTDAPVPSIEAARALIAEARSHRLGHFNPHEFTAEKALDGLTLTLCVLLDEIDYDDNIAAFPSMIARALAACIANMEDHMRVLS